jgi:glycosyltransferase involved in cell wall biosynthesis
MGYSALAAVLLRTGRFDVHHHVLPFALDRTITPAAHARPPRVAFVVGPVQTPLPVADDGVRRNPDAWRRSPAGRALARSSARGLAAADAVVAVSDAAAALVSDRGALPQRVTVIPPGVDTDFWRPPAERDRGHGRLVTVSQLVRRKRVDRVISALAAALPSVPGASLTVVGDGPERRNLEQLSRRLGVAGRVSFTGQLARERVAAAYRDADAFVFGSDSESAGQVYLEALASGLPVVSVRNTGTDALIGPDLGRVVAADDVRGLAAAIISVLCDDGLRNQLATQARQRAVDGHDWRQVIIPSYLDIYLQALERRHATQASGVR